jgi:metallo-beta-lactamase class B
MRWTRGRLRRPAQILSLCVLSLLVILLLFPLALTAAPKPQANANMRALNRPVAPFRIIGNIYYVGASDITSFLIVSREGDILIDGGLVETAPQIEANIQKLGFRLSDVKILLNSHAHYDHAGGLSELERATGAQFYASVGDAPVLQSGGRSDFFFGDSLTFPPVKVDRLLRDGDVVKLGGTTLTAHLTPGHTKGCTTWTTTAEENGTAHPVVFVCSTTVLSGVRLVNNPAYPNIASDFEHTFQTLKSLPCDVFLASHGSFFNLTDKRAALRREPKSNPFVDPAGYRAYVVRSEAAFREELHRQQAQTKAPAT